MKLNIIAGVFKKHSIYNLNTKNLRGENPKRNSRQRIGEMVNTFAQLINLFYFFPLEII